MHCCYSSKQDNFDVVPIVVSLWSCVSICSQLAKIDHTYWIIRSILKNKCIHTDIDDI